MANDAVRRIMAEVKEFSSLNNAPNTFIYAAPLETDLFEWHFTVRGPPETAFADGVYHGRIVLPAEYPLKAPEIILLTPNGRFEVGKRICLSVTSHHQETWRPSWGIRTIITALVGFMPSKAEGVGALDYPDSDRKALARKSWHFQCQRCDVRPIEHIVIPAAVAKGVPGAACLPDDHTPEQPTAVPASCSASASSSTSNPASASSSFPSSASASTSASPASVPSSDTPASSVTPGLSIGTNANTDDVAPSQVPETSSQSIATSPMEQNDQTLSDVNETTDAVSSVTQPSTPPNTASSSSNAAQPVVQTRNASLSRAPRPQQGQERELLYLAYAIVVLIAAVILRRVVSSTLE